ncbi:hypothetical protein BKA70DRAFT_1492308 [Coprinopsis sp. MPI-PUGE-AT-0042]|nr:hypothetical protein BKA70DRAFT_1492308 [Coprinopsis sp. MPI-PUGE-AT-0042]
MDTTDMLIEAHAIPAASATTNSGQETVGTCLADDLSPTIESMTLEELDVGGSEFSWSSVGSEPSPPIPDELAVTFEGTPREEVAVVKETLPLNQLTVSTGTPMEHAPALSMQKHSLYFWDSIMFKVEGIIFQLPKYRFVEESEAFMEMVAKGGGDGPIDLDVALVEFESFLKVFLPRASAMYDDKPGLTLEEWISVLKLSTLWLFNDLRELAISNLSWPWLCPISDPIDLICLAKEYRVQGWLLQGYEQVIDRLITVNGPDGEPMTLTAQEGKRIGMDVALELSGVAIRRMRLAERNFPSRDTRADISDVFNQEFDCVRKEETRFRGKAERLKEEARKKEDKETKKKAEEEAKLQEMEGKAAQRVLEEEAEKERVLREVERKKEAEMELEHQGEEAREKPQLVEPKGMERAEGLAPNPMRRLSKKEWKQLAQEAQRRQLEEEEMRLLEEVKLSEGENIGRLENEEPEGLEEEEIEKLKKETAQRLEEEVRLRWEEENRKRDEERELELQKQQREWEERNRKRDRKLRALAIEELRRRKGLANEKAKEEKSSG